MRVFVYEHLCSGALAGQSGAGSLRREGLAMLEAALIDLARCPGVVVCTLVEEGLVGRLRSGMSCWEIYPVEAFAGELHFRHLARGADFTLVIAPEFGDLLADRCAWALAESSRLLGPTPDAVRLTGDKLALATHLRQRGVPVVELWRAGDPGDRALTRPARLPVVCKPRFGAGSQHTLKVEDAEGYRRYVEDRERAGDALGEAVFGPWVPGLPASVSFLAGPGGCIALPAAKQTLSSEGRFRYLGGRVPLAPPLQERAQCLATRAVRAVPGLAGWFGVDVVLGPDEDGDEDVVIEINPRLTTSYVGLRQLARGNLMEALLQTMQGRDVGELGWHDRTVRFGANGSIY
jgi:predicted ATP-grasp superfamily ATP-dependent carboligase